MRKQHESIKPRIERLAQKFNDGERFTRERKMSVISFFNDFFSSLEYKNNFARSTKQELVKFLKGKNIEIKFEKFSEYLILFQNNYKYNITTLRVDRHNGVTVYEVEKY